MDFAKWSSWRLRHAGLSAVSVRHSSSGPGNIVFDGGPPGGTKPASTSTDRTINSTEAMPHG
jgi:hypothetical protein